MRFGMLYTLVSVSLFLSGCNPIYVMQAAYVEGDILLRRKKIDDLLKDEELPQATAQKLSLVKESRQFALKNGFRAGGSFLYYSQIDGPISWLLTAVKKDSFTPYTWWFPFVGRVPYKGFFSREAGIAAAQRLQKLGYETSLRGVEAFSTLGWFDDPILSPLLERSPAGIVETVFHEIVHSTIWIPGDVAFNESLAQFIALKQSLEFSRQQESEDPSLSLESVLARHDEFQHYAQLVSDAYAELDKLYNSEIPSHEKLQEKDRIYTAFISTLKKKTPRLAVVTRPNNAELMSAHIYTQKFPLLERLFTLSGGDLRVLLQFIEKVADCRPATKSSGLFSLTKNALTEESIQRVLQDKCPLFENTHLSSS
jgi:predicted aminopeptidase